MGYFSMLQKCSRNEGGWTGYKYTGSAAAGADLVSEDTWCVVYTANVIYEGEMEKISGLTVSTNFVNPLSSGNPCTVSCYLYTSDPTSGGNAAVTAAPFNYVASAAASFEASTVGDYISFSFSGLNIRPSQVYFWFRSTVSYESFGSNSIYHYATGNYSSAMNTGTRTPQLQGSFVGTNSGADGGGVEGEEYTAIASGAYGSIFARQNFSYSRAWHTASYTALSFTGSGAARFVCSHGSGGDSFLQMRAYLSTDSGFDKYAGRPSGTIVASVSGNDSYNFKADVVSGQTYYLWTVIDYCGTDTVPLNLSIIPEAWNYTLVNLGSHTNIDQSTRTFTMNMGAFQTGRMALSFAYSAYVEVTVSGSEGAFSAMILVSEGENIDNATGLPLRYTSSFYMNGSGSMSVEKGKNYYFFAIYNGGSEAGAVTFTIKPPPVVWTQSGNSSYSMLASTASSYLSLGVEKYHFIKLSVAHSGFLWLKGTNISSSGYGNPCVYICDKDCFNSYYGYPMSTVSSVYLYEGYETPVDLIAGQDYYIYIVNTDHNQALSAVLTLRPTEAPIGYSDEGQRRHQIESSLIQEKYLRRYGYTLDILSYKYRGETKVSLGKSSWNSGNTVVHLRAYLCREAGIDNKSGLPLGTVLSSYTGLGENFSFSFTAQEDVEYYLYTVCEEIYGAYAAQMELSIISPPARYFSVTDTGEYYALADPIQYEASPGESGVLRLELSFEKAGVATIEGSLSSGSDYLMAWVSSTPYMDGRSGRPSQNIIVSASGNAGEPGFSLSFPVRRLESVYLFVRGEGVYDAADFILSVSHRAGAMRLYLQGEYKMAQPHVFYEDRWQAAMPLCFADGSWHSGG